MKGALRDSRLPTLADTVGAQDDLDALCRDRALVTRELFTPNAFYGHDSVLKRYAEVRQDRPIFAVIPHGQVLDPTFIWGPEARITLPAVLCYPQHRARAYKATTKKVVIDSASPYVYATKLVASSSPTSRKGTLFFLSHSTHHVIKEESTEHLAEQLTEVPPPFAPITVCVYWKDYLLGRHLPFLRQGLAIVSAGHIYDPLFLFRLHHLCSLHQYSTGSTVGSHTFCSVHSGCTHLQLPGLRPPPPFGFEGARITTEPDALRVEVPPDVEELPDVRNTFFTEQPDRALQTTAGGYFLGYAHELSQRELKQQLLLLRNLDRFGYGTSPQTGSLRRFPPTVVHRATIRSRMMAGRMTRKLSNTQGPD